LILEDISDLINQMKIASFLPLLASVLSVTADYAHNLRHHPHPEELTPGLRDPGPIDATKPIYRFQGKGGPEIRCPCPYVNAAANHGILPFDGKNIHLETFRLVANKGGFSDGIFSFTIKALKKIAKIFHDKDVAAGKSNPHPLDRLDLWEIGIHGPIEHDFSISRWDVNLPDQDPNDRAVPPDLIPQLIEKYGHKKDGCYLTKDDFALWRKDRRDQEKELGKRKDDYNIPAQVAAAGEIVFSIHMFGRHKKLSCDFARSFFLEERIPDDWQPPQQMPLLRFIPHMLSAVVKYLSPSALIKVPAKYLEAVKEMYSDD